MTAVALEPQRGHVRAFLRLVMIEHSVFALPFAYLGVLYASFDRTGDVHWRALGLVTIALVAARTFAMAVNRIVDRRLDARNPRTAQRELVTGAVSVRTAAVGSAVSLVVFVVVAGVLSPLCLALSPIALALFVVYPYGKRFTWLCHAILGLAQTCGPVGAWLATTRHWSWSSVLLGLGVGLWIGGFDLIYALQDIDSDRAGGIYSLPARFGASVALRVSEAAHIVTLGLFVAFGLREGAGAFWWIGVAVTAGAFAYEHAIVKPDDLSRVNRAFFTTNGLVGIALFAFGLFDLLARGLGA
ncbi:MAG TPA: menaquinone biosynthesis prenyltransferase MqnP [Mycobacteriales bacterium]|nr:menaquinone biosynthesis prenyltransferase MqnP [Mycobacteriales bacterium]